MPKWLLFPKYLIFFSSIWLPFLSSPNHFSLHRTYFRENNGRICLTDLCSCHLWCLFYLLIFFSWLLTTLFCSLSFDFPFFFFFCSPCAYCDVCNRLEEKSKGVVDRSSTVIAKEPEGTCLISALICFLGFFFKSFFLHFSHAKRNTRQNNTNVKKKSTTTHKRRQKTFVGLGVLFLFWFFFHSTWYAQLPPLPPMTETTRV